MATAAMSDEQALLAKVRYNRLIDVFLGLVAYSLQNHLRTTVTEMGQIEIDEIYVKLDARDRAIRDEIAKAQATPHSTIAEETRDPKIGLILVVLGVVLSALANIVGA